MPRRLRTIPGPSRLSGILAHLTKQPRLELNAELKKLKVSYKFKNGDFGARYFVKEELPRIRYANPDLEIEVDKLNPSNPSHRTRDPSMVLEFTNTPSKILPLSQKWSTQIVTDLMSVAGSPFIWSKWVEERTARGESLYVDRYGNGQGKEGYVKRPRVWRVGWARKAGYSRKEKVVETGGTVSLGIEKKEIEDGKTEDEGEGDELKTLLGLGTMPIETGPPKIGIATALP